MKRNLFLEFPDNLVSYHNIDGEGFPMKREGSAFG